MSEKRIVTSCSAHPAALYVGAGNEGRICGVKRRPILW